MSARNGDIDLSMLEFYRLEADDQTRILTEELLALERAPTAPAHLEACMRAAHSLKGAARIIGFEAGVRVAHAMEDCFVAAQRGAVILNQEQIDTFLRDIDILRNPIGGPPDDVAGTADGDRDDMYEPARRPSAVPAQTDTVTRAEPRGRTPEAARGLQGTAKQQTAHEGVPAVVADSDDRMLRVTAQHLDRLLRLAGEALVEARRV
jgi:two-component system sensor histidine kinase and response regulator WspE